MKKALRPVSFLAALLTLLTVFASTGAADPPSVHDTVYFGSFPQTADGNAEPLKWLVLEVRDDKALIITEKVIDAMDFAPGAPAYWENSVLRAWMNGPFVSAAFTEEEQELLIPTEIRDEDESMNPTVTTDIFFALSREEAERYFPSDADRRAAPTPYALEKKDPYRGRRVLVVAEIQGQYIQRFQKVDLPCGDGRLRLSPRRRRLPGRKGKYRRASRRMGAFVRPERQR